MEEKLTKKLAQKLMKVEGECRGMHFKNDAQYVLQKEGKQGLRKVEEEMERLDCPIKYQEVKSLGFYPVGLRAVSLLALQKVFGWGNKEVRELSGYAPYVSLIVKIYMKFFHSLDEVVKKAPKMWHEYYTVGEVSIPEYSEKKKYAILELKDFDLHPVFCRGMEGYLENIVKMIVKTKKTECRETKCVFEGQDCHQFKIRWE